MSDTTPLEFLAYLVEEYYVHISCNKEMTEIELQSVDEDNLRHAITYFKLQNQVSSRDNKINGGGDIGVTVGDVYFFVHFYDEEEKSKLINDFNI